MSDLIIFDVDDAFYDLQDVIENNDHIQLTFFMNMLTDGCRAKVAMNI